MIFPSTLIISTDQNLIDSYYQKLLTKLGHSNITNNPDLFLVSENSIAAIRQITNFLSLKAYSHQNKIIMVPDIDSFHLEAQNALLKILEEPGKNNYFILTSKHSQKVINTVSSRCQIIKLNSKIKSSLAIYFPKNTLRDDIPEIKEFLETQLSLHQHELIKNPSTYQKNLVSRLIKSLSLISANVDPKSALDFFLLS